MAAILINREQTRSFSLIRALCGPLALESLNLTESLLCHSPQRFLQDMFLLVIACRNKVLSADLSVYCSLNPGIVLILGVHLRYLWIFTDHSPHTFVRGTSTSITLDQRWFMIVAFHHFSGKACFWPYSMNSSDSVFDSSWSKHIWLPAHPLFFSHRGPFYIMLLGWVRCWTQVFFTTSKISPSHSWT